MGGRSRIVAGVAGLLVLAGGLLGPLPGGVMAAPSMALQGVGSGPSPAAVAATAGSRAPAAGIAYRHYEGRYFAALVPRGWQVAGESRNGIDIVAPGLVAAVSFGYVTGYAPGTVTVTSFQASLLATTGLRITKVIGTQRVRPFTSGPGMTWTGRITEFEGLYRGQRVHGVVTVQIGHSAAGDAAMLYMRVAQAKYYRALSPVMITVQRSITVIRTK